MEQHLLDYVEIKDFKCFKDFKAEGFKRVNLIGGKNNVGKTAFMEACYVNVSAMNLKSFVGAIISIKYMRENLNILSEYIDEVISFQKEIKLRQEYIELSNHIFAKSNKNLCSFKIEDNEGIKKYNFNFNDDFVSVNINSFSFEMKNISNINFIDNFGLSNQEIITSYSAIQTKKDEIFLDNILKKFDNRIESFKIMDNKPKCEIDGAYREITEFGDGVRHLVSIVTALFVCEDGYLFIDEIDNGIHYTHLDEIWAIILEVSQKLNVQVFATTHSKECIESYARVSKKLEDEDISYIKLSKQKDGVIHAGVRGYDILENSIAQDHEVR